MPKHTSLYQRHRDAGARMVDFAGWEMPLHYGSQLHEHRVVRSDSGMFDVSHMNQVELVADDAEAFLRAVCANDVARLEDGGAAYTCLLNERAGVIDDGIVYRFAAGRYRLVVNAATREKDLDWLRGHAERFHVEPQEASDLAMIAVQGPQARTRAGQALEEAFGRGLARAAEGLGRFKVTCTGQIRVARTGYTGEDGYEIMLPGAEAPALWDALSAAGVAPVGLGARDTLRLEAGLALYGHEMDEEVTPLEAGLGWTIAWKPEERDFIGRGTLAEQRAQGATRQLVGLLPEGRAVPREGQTVFTGAGEGVVTSGGFAPTLDRPVALARVPVGAEGDCDIQIRQRRVTARITDYPFVRHGKPRH